MPNETTEVLAGRGVLDAAGVDVAGVDIAGVDVAGVENTTGEVMLGGVQVQLIQLGVASGSVLDSRNGQESLPPLADRSRSASGDPL